jgi:hypothetical protein
VVNLSRCPHVAVGVRAIEVGLVSPRN